MNTKNPEFPLPEELIVEDERLDSLDPASAGEGLTEATNIPFDEEVERIVQPEPVGD